jgi:DegV family protein with EDD domain
MSSNKEIAIVTDSTADIPECLVHDFEINVVPNVMIIDGKSVEDGLRFTREQFYSSLPEMKPIPTTSTPATGTFEQLYAKLLAHGKSQIVSVHAASALSGIYNSARLAASRFRGQIHVLDSEQLSLGLGFQVLAAAEAASTGASLERILEVLQYVRLRARVIAMLDTLEYVRRSGRVSWARARLGNLLSIKPFVEVRNGKVMSIGETRTRRKGIDRLKELLLNLGPLEKLAILHTNAESDAREFLDDLNHYIVLPAQPMVVNITTIIGVYTGPNGLGFAAILKQ